MLAHHTDSYIYEIFFVFSFLHFTHTKKIHYEQVFLSYTLSGKGSALRWWRERALMGKFCWYATLGTPWRTYYETRCETLRLLGEHGTYVQ